MTIITVVVTLLLKTHLMHISYNELAKKTPQSLFRHDQVCIIILDLEMIICLSHFFLMQNL